MSLPRRRPRTSRRKPEPTIALINIVFLMLVFFLVAGTLAPPIDPEMELVDTRQLDGREPANALVLTAAGDLQFRGAALRDVTAYVETLPTGSPARILPDRAVAAAKLVETAQALRAAGISQVLIITANHATQVP